MSTLRWHFGLGLGLPSRAIAWWGQGYGGWSHVDYLLPSGEYLGARSDRVGGKPPGVQIRPAGYTQWKRRTIIELDCTELEQIAGEAFLTSQINHGYDKANIWGFLTGRELHTPGHWVCSAIQLDMLEVMKKIKKLHITPQQCPPNMLFSIIDVLPGSLVRVLSA